MRNASSGFRRIAHRGASGELPENTLLAIQAAVENYRVDMVEIDLRLTRDGIPVLLHDPTLERTTDGRGPVSDRSLSELKKLDAGFWFDPAGNETFPFRGKGVVIPALEEVLLRFPETAFCLEIKEREGEIVRKVLETARKVSRKGNLLIGSSYGKIARALRQTAPASFEILLSREDLIWAHLLFRIGLRKFKPPSLYASIPTIWHGIRLDDPRWIEFLHRSGVRVFYWTENEASRMEELLNRGADGIVTDYPDRLNQLLGRSS
jgi:glycerophosphoryl diester phosphodiesterase